LTCRIRPESRRPASLKPSRFGGSIRFRIHRYFRGPMPQNYVPIFLFLAVVGTLIPITLLVARVVRTQSPNRVKLMPYECGIDPYDSARGRYTVRFYIVAILFVVFEVETIFLFPWAVKFKSLGGFGLIEMLIFLGILIVAYIWIWKKGALEWV
jgi:NADH-quinone oxidoreductase subunit A